MVVNSVTELIGNTPILKLNKYTDKKDDSQNRPFFIYNDSTFCYIVRHIGGFKTELTL